MWQQSNSHVTEEKTDPIEFRVFFYKLLRETYIMTKFHGFTLFFFFILYPLRQYLGTADLKHKYDYFLIAQNKMVRNEII